MRQRCEWKSPSGPALHVAAGPLCSARLANVTAPALPVRHFCARCLAHERTHHTMPLVRIDVIEGRSDEEVRALADAVQDVMMEVFAAPARDRYQVIHEHRPGRLIAEDTGLGLERTDRVVIIQVTQQGRSDSQKKALYAALANALESRAGVSPSDLIVSVVANTNADWSFGLGRAQFLEGDL
jgi:phenylpyruvate tautomerase PptA (4-oxalocrotonate tautomerase family)